MHQVFSPDGFSISAVPFQTAEKALKYFEYWKKQFEPQGYYSTMRFGYRELIKIEDLKKECVFKKTDWHIPYIEPVYKPQKSKSK